MVTTLQESLPIIRYETNDLVVAAGPEPCKCGSVTTRVASFEGRRKDILVGSDGTPRTERQVDDALALVDGLRFYQVTQSAPARLSLKVVANPSTNAAHVRSQAGEALRSVMWPGAEMQVDGAKRLYPRSQASSALPGPTSTTKRRSS